ncbi:hypothetical protein [Naasia aerilata]|uniref:Phosphodiesterase n=1 Tax=Naasia aerilata TaxID=1162966 RepID=A0ABN6XUU6_9MICO|nr:hypothetical protein [Naasia aerilata]BDZ47431.1 hypothetical protein GCM10025866_33400 [Naasia aerilata]
MPTFRALRRRLAPSALIGDALGVLFSIVLLVRRPRPIHARGVLFDAVVTWRTGPARSGIGWIDGSGVQSGIARVSRSAGLPAPLPDILGLALRVQTPTGPADLELSTTGVGVPGRFLLLPHSSARRAWFGCLLPYRGTQGPVLVGARLRTAGDLPADPREAVGDGSWTLDLFWATPRGRWHRFAVLELRRHAHETVDADAPRFDAARRPLPGAGIYAWVAAVRERSYRLAQAPADGDSAEG